MLVQHGCKFLLSKLHLLEQSRIKLKIEEQTVPRFVKFNFLILVPDIRGKTNSISTV